MITSAQDWIEQAQKAKEILIAEHGLREADFLTIETREDAESACLGWCGDYPEAWGEHIRKSDDGKLIISGWLKASCIPKGLVVYWPEGTDFNGEGYDATDAVQYLSETLFWQNISDEEMRDMFIVHPDLLPRRTTQENE